MHGFEQAANHREDRVQQLSQAPDIIWGAKEIAKILGMNERMAFHWLEGGQIPAARRIGGRWCEKRKRWFGGRWCASRRELLRMFVPTEHGDQHSASKE
jgi:hypothetical protein